MFLHIFPSNTTTKMTIVGWNAAMHAASIIGQPGKALEFLEEAKVSSAAARQTNVLSTLQREGSRGKRRWDEEGFSVVACQVDVLPASFLHRKPETFL